MKSVNCKFPIILLIVFLFIIGISLGFKFNSIVVFPSVESILFSSSSSGAFSYCFFKEVILFLITSDNGSIYNVLKL